MTPILCCGEALEIRKAGTYVDFVLGQIRAALAGWKAEEVAKIVIAYEHLGYWHRRDCLCAGRTGSVRRHPSGARRGLRHRDSERPAFCTAALRSPVTSRNSWPSPTLTVVSSAALP